MARRRGPDRRSPAALAGEVGSRLREQRRQLSKTLREVANDAQISAAHLSDIENGHSHASLPVLLRLGRALDLPIAQLLPRLGSHHMRRGSVRDEPGETVLSHPDLQLVVTGVNLEPEDRHRLAVRENEDTFIFVIGGRCVIGVDGIRYELSTHDCVDVERARTIEVTGIGFTRLLICRGRRR